MNEKKCMKKISDEKMDMVLSEFFACLPEMPDRSKHIMDAIHTKSLQPDAGVQPLLWVLIISFAAVASYFKDWILGTLVGSHVIVAFVKLSSLFASAGLALGNWFGLMTDWLSAGTTLATAGVSLAMMVLLFVVFRRNKKAHKIWKG